MIARGFKPVGLVAAVGGAALGCYMLSLQVASARAELQSIDGRILAAKQDIRSLQTELGTRGRLQQLEHWNAEILALSAPTSQQFLDSEVTLARFNQPAPKLEDKAKVRMAALDTSTLEAPVSTFAVAPQPDTDAQETSQPIVRRASLEVGAKPLNAVKPALLAKPVERELAAIAISERTRAGAAGQ